MCWIISERLRHRHFCGILVASECHRHICGILMASECHGIFVAVSWLEDATCRTAQQRVLIELQR